MLKNSVYKQVNKYTITEEGSKILSKLSEQKHLFEVILQNKEMLNIYWSLKAVTLYIYETIGKRFKAG